MGNLSSYYNINRISEIGKTLKTFVNKLGSNINLCWIEDEKVLHAYPAYKQERPPGF